jgi:hypothetical protein
MTEPLKERRSFCGPAESGRSLNAKPSDHADIAEASLTHYASIVMVCS